MVACDIVFTARPSTRAIAIVRIADARARRLMSRGARFAVTLSKCFRANYARCRMPAACASLPAVAGRLCLSGITPAPSGSISPSPRWMIRKPFRHRWLSGLKTNFPGSNFIRRAKLFRATGTKSPSRTGGDQPRFTTSRPQTCARRTARSRRSPHRCR